MTYKFNEPPARAAFDDKTGAANPAWLQWVGQVHEVSGTLLASGTTANRPPIKFVGQQYFDTSLGANGKPIFANKVGTGWVLADGTAA